MLVNVIVRSYLCGSHCKRKQHEHFSSSFNGTNSFTVHRIKRLLVRENDVSVASKLHHTFV